MLVWLDQSILAADLEANTDACHGIHNLLSSAYRGEHYVLAERETLIGLRDNAHISIAGKAIVKRLISEYSMLLAFARQLQTRVIVTHGKATVFAKPNPNVWEVPLVHFGQSGIAKSVLVTENLDDARLFVLAAGQYRTEAGLAGTVSVEMQGGGGSTTPPVLENAIICEKRWALCICDSDRLHPMQSMDVTAAKCRAIASRAGCVSDFIDLVLREVENVIPLSFLEVSVPPTHAYHWDRHRKAVFAAAPQAHQFGDLKLGTDLRKILAYGDGTAERAFWMEAARTLSKSGCLPAACLDGDECPMKPVDNSSCGCIVVHGYGQKILVTVIERLTQQSIHKSLEIIKFDENRIHWMMIGKRVFEWGCAPLRMRT